MKSSPMDERRLLAILREEEADASSYYKSELAQVQTEAYERYFGEKYGNEIEGHPQVVSQDVEDTINWMMPHLMRLFLATDDLLLVQDDQGDNVQMEQEAADYLEHIFYKDNEGDSILHDFIFDGLLSRLGVVSIAYEEPKPQTPKEYDDLPPQRLNHFVQSPEHEILEAEENEPNEAGEVTYSVKVQRTPRTGKFVVEGVAPEEFGISSRAKSIKEADYVRRKQEIYLSELGQMFPDFRGVLDPTGAHSADDSVDDLDSDPRRQARFEDEVDDQDHSNTAERRKVDLLTEWIRIDYDGDGVVELRQVKRVGNTILENLAVDRCDLVEWSPIRISHRAIGRSVAEQIFELAKIRTDLMRYLLLNLEQTLNPRTFVDTNDDDVIDQMLDRQVGDVIRMQRPRENVYESISPDVTPSIYPALEYADQRAEQASGVMRHAQGHRAEGVTDTASGIRNLQSAANARIELIGRWAAKGVEQIFERILELVSAHQTQPRIIRNGDKRMQIDPRMWSEDMKVSIHVGIAAETREEKINKLMIISQKQEQILMQAPQNPIVGLEQYGGTLQLIAREGGFRNPERFFKNVPEGYDQAKAQEAAQAGPQQDPKAQEAQARIQIEQAKAQAQAQLEKQKLDFEQQASSREMQFKEQLAARDAETQRTLQEMKLQSDMQLQNAKLQNEREIALIRVQSEREIAEMRMEQERELAEQKAEDQKEIAKASIASKANGSTNGSGGMRPGGALHK